MNKRPLITDLAAALTYTLGLGFTVMRVLNTDVAFLSFLLYAVIVFAVVTPIVTYKQCAIAFAIIAALGLLLFFYNFQYCAQLTMQFAERVVLFFRGETPLRLADSVLISCVILVPLSTASVIFAGRRGGALLLTITSAAFFVIAWEIGYTDIMPGLCACAVSIILVFASSYAGKFVKTENASAVARRAALFVLPLALLAVSVFALLLPQNTTGTRVPFVENFFDDIADVFGPIIGYSGRVRRPFTFSDYGYNSELGGSVTLNNAPVMTVSGAYSFTLLRGSIKDTYTGHSWTDAVIPSTYRFDAPLQKNHRDTVFGIDLPDEPPAVSFIRPTKININFVGSDHSSTLFTSGRPTSVSSDNAQQFIPYFDDQGELFSKYYISRSSSYTVEDSTLLWTAPGFYGAVTRLETKVADKKADGHSPDPQYNDILEQYTQLPELSPYVTNYAAGLTAEQNSPYKKAYAIMEHLRGSFTYSLSVPSVPSNVEFVEWFLQTGVGYCTYFASAMTVLARASGIPARYVEGFSLYGLTPRENGEYTVRGSQAHAWCEVYLEGIGWIPFDATAPGSSAFPLPTSPEEEQDNQTSSPEDNPDDESRPDRAPSTPQAVDVSDTTDEQKPFPWAQLVIILLAAFAAAPVMLAALKSRFRESRLRKKFAPGECLMLCWRDIINMLEHWGIAHARGETCEGLAERVGETLPFETCPFSEVARITELYLYGGVDPAPKALSAVIGFRQEMDTALLKKLRPLRYIAQRIQWLPRKKAKAATRTS